MKYPANWLRFGLPFLVALAVVPPALAQTPPALEAASEFAAAVMRTDSIPGAYEVVHWAERGLVFVASSPSFDDGAGGSIHVLDAADLHPIRQIQLPRRPFALALDRSTGRLYAGNTVDGSLTVIDAAGGQILDTIQLGESSDDGFEHVRMIELDEARGLAFVTSPGEKGLAWIVDTKAGKPVHRIDVGLWTSGAAHDQAAGRFYAGGGGIEEIVAIDAQGEKAGVISTGDTKAAGGDASRHFFVNLALDPQNRRLFAADANTGSLYVFDVDTGKIVANVPTGTGTLDVAYNAVRSEAYVTWRGVTREDTKATGGLTVIDTSDFHVKRRVPLPSHPNSIDVSADGRTLFLTVRAPRDKEHPDFREGAMDSVVRIDLEKLDSQGK